MFVVVLFCVLKLALWWFVRFAVAGQAQENGNESCLIFVRQFLADGGEDIPEYVLQDRYDQLFGYIRGRLDKYYVVSR